MATTLLDTSLTPQLQELSACLPNLPSDWQEGVAARLKWLKSARPNQITPPGEDWDVWLLLAGRGFGKTRSGAEDMGWYAMTNAGVRCAVVGRTYTDVRDVCFEGESGLLAVIPNSWVKSYTRSLGSLCIELTNGSLIFGYGSESPDKLRGPQHHRAWADELAAWEDMDAWDQLLFGLRLGRNPQAVVTTTPRPIAILKDLVSRVGGDVRMSTGSTYENAQNLPERFLRRLRERYEGTRLGRQELFAELLFDVPGALWSYESFVRVASTPDLERIVVAVDPAVTSRSESAETGIIVAGKCTVKRRGLGFILHDGTLRGRPEEWASRAISLYRQYQADAIVAEVNNGGDLVEHTIHTVDPNVKVVKVRASRGKIIRAEPVSALYEQGRVFHLGLFHKLEDQMVSYDGEGKVSPDRMDAAVWAITQLLLDSKSLALGKPHAVPNASPFST